MTWSIPTVGSRTQTEDRGAVLRCKCPECEKLALFNALCIRTSITFMIALKGKPVEMLDIVCSLCGYTMRAEPGDIAALEQCRSMVQMLTCGEMSEADYEAQLRSLKVGFIRRIVRMSDQRECPQCGEVSPSTLTECWNCSCEREGAIPEIVSETDGESTS